MIPASEIGEARFRNPMTTLSPAERGCAVHPDGMVSAYFGVVPPEELPGKNAAAKGVAAATGSGALGKASEAADEDELVSASTVES